MYGLWIVAPRAAPPAIQAAFTAFNKEAKQAAKAGGRSPQPAIIVSKAHGVLHAQTADGSVNLWAAPEEGGGTCSYVVWNPERNEGGATSCLFIPGDSFPQGLVWSRQAADRRHPYQLIDGYTVRSATEVRVLLAGGSTKTMTVVERYFLGAFPREAKIISLTARNAHGHIVGYSRVK